MLVELAWLWLRRQPGSALSRWFHGRVRHNGGRLKGDDRGAGERKLLVAPWEYAAAGIVIEGAVMEARLTDGTSGAQMSTGT